MVRLNGLGNSLLLLKLSSLSSGGSLRAADRNSFNSILFIGKVVSIKYKSGVAYGNYLLEKLLAPFAS